MLTTATMWGVSCGVNVAPLQGQWISWAAVLELIVVVLRKARFKLNPHVVANRGWTLKSDLLEVLDADDVSA